MGVATFGEGNICIAIGLQISILRSVNQILLLIKSKKSRLQVEDGIFLCFIIPLDYSNGFASLIQAYCEFFALFSASTTITTKLKFSPISEERRVGKVLR